jgi:hypothetical protein
MKGFLIFVISLVSCQQLVATEGRCTSHQYERIERCHEQTDQSKCNGQCFWASVGFAHCTGQAEEWFACKNYDEKACNAADEFTPGCRWVVEK